MVIHLMDEFSLDSLLKTRKSQEIIDNLIAINCSDSQENKFMAMNEKLKDDDMFFIKEFEKGLELIDLNEFPMSLFEDKLTWNILEDAVVLPRLKKWLFDLMTLLPSRKIMASQLVLFTLLQEALLVPEEKKVFGELIYKYGNRLPNYTLHLDIYLNLFYEAVISSKSVLPYFISFLHPKIFQQEMNDSYYNHSDIILIILSCLMCKEVHESSHICYIIKTLEKYLNEPLDDCFQRILNILEQIILYDQPNTISRMVSSIPLNNINGILITKWICFHVISKYLEVDKIENADELICNIPKLKELCDSSIELKTLKAEVVITLIEKLCFLLIKTKSISLDQLTSISNALHFQISHSFGTYVELKEHLFLVSKQIEFFSMFLKNT